METPELQEKLKEFQCQRCNLCCKQPGFVYLAPGEEETLASSLKMDVYAFIESYCEVSDRRRLVLKKNPDESCVFLTEDGCSVHPAKPRQCREFPVGWRTEKSFDYCEGLKKIFRRSE